MIFITSSGEIFLLFVHYQFCFFFFVHFTIKKKKKKGAAGLFSLGFPAFAAGIHF